MISVLTSNQSHCKCASSLTWWSSHCHNHFEWTIVSTNSALLIKKKLCSHQMVTFYVNTWRRKNANSSNQIHTILIVKSFNWKCIQMWRNHLQCFDATVFHLIRIQFRNHIFINLEQWNWHRYDVFSFSNSQAVPPPSSHCSITYAQNPKINCVVLDKRLTCNRKREERYLYVYFSCVMNNIFDYGKPWASYEIQLDEIVSDTIREKSTKMFCNMEQYQTRYVFLSIIRNVAKKSIPFERSVPELNKTKQNRKFRCNLQTYKMCHTNKILLWQSKEKVNFVPCEQINESNTLRLNSFFTRR